MVTRLVRKWINQPSTHQPDHDRHGQNVLCYDTGERFVDVWFTTGPVVSMRIDRLSLSDGWKS